MTNLGNKYYKPHPKADTISVKLEFIEINQLNVKLNEIEHQDLYHILDDTDISIWTLNLIMHENKIQFPAGVRIRIPCEKFSFTPYFYYETEAQKQEYEEFIKKIISHKKPKR